MKILPLPEAAANATATAEGGKDRANNTGFKLIV